jgi:hypothetical protein
VASREHWKFQKKVKRVAGCIKSILECSRRRLRAWHHKCAGVKSVASKALSKFQGQVRRIATRAIWDVPGEN